VKGKSLLLSQIYLKEYPPYGIFAEHNDLCTNRHGVSHPSRAKLV
jgi:hypothetical protein